MFPGNYSRVQSISILRISFQNILKLNQMLESNAQYWNKLRSRVIAIYKQAIYIEYMNFKSNKMELIHSELSNVPISNCQIIFGSSQIQISQIGNTDKPGPFGKIAEDINCCSVGTWGQLQKTNSKLSYFELETI